MKPQEKKKLAHSLFVKGNMTRKSIADQVGVQPKTLKSWIDKGNWEDMKEAQAITRPQLLQDAYNQLRAINLKVEELGGVPNKELSDAKAIVRKEIETFSNSPLHQYVEVFEEFIGFISKHSPEDLIRFAELSNEFIEVLAKKKS